MGAAVGVDRIPTELLEGLTAYTELNAEIGQFCELVSTESPVLKADL